MLTQVRAIKRMSGVLKKLDRAANDIFKGGIEGKTAQESLVNWLIEKVDIQRAHKISSTEGIILHAYQRLAAAFMTLNF